MSKSTDWWEVQAQSWPGGKFQIVSDSPTATVGSSLTSACAVAQELLDAGEEEVSIYHVINDNRRFHGWYRPPGQLVRMA